MKIEKLPSGKYRIRQMKEGKTYSATVPYKPTQKEAYAILQNKMNHKRADQTFKDACELYIKAKSNVLSPTTLRGYNAIYTNMPASFLALDLNDIDTFMVQTFINDYSADHKPKTVHNVYGFISAVCAFFNPEILLHVQLPPKQRKQAYNPTSDDVKALLKYSKGTKFYVPIFLASLSLRLGEICALTVEDLNGDALTINKCLVIDTDNNYIIKETPKTDASNRVIILPHELVEAINEQGYVYKGHHTAINKYLHRSLPELGIPYFSIHQLRHFFASYSHDLGYSDAVIQSIGGWSTDHVMKSVYRYAMNESDAKKAIASDFSF